MNCTAAGCEEIAPEEIYKQVSDGSEPPPNHPSPSGNRPLKKVALKLIWFYQHYLSPLTPPACRFYPTCSHYTYEAIERFGFWRGGWLGLCRLCKCHPFHRGGIDPVPAVWPGGQSGGQSDVVETQVKNKTEN